MAVQIHKVVIIFLYKTFKPTHTNAHKDLFKLHVCSLHDHLETKTEI